MADKPEVTSSEQDLETLRQHHESNAAEQAEQTASDARQLEAREYSQTPPEEGQSEQPFGSRKDDTALVVDRDGTAAALKQEGSSIEFVGLTGEVENDGVNTETGNTHANEAAQADLFPPDQPEDVAQVQIATDDPENPVIDRGEARLRPDSGPVESTITPNPGQADDPETLAAAPAEEEVEDEEILEAQAEFGEVIAPPVAQAPGVQAAAATGDEDTDIPLNIDVASLDSDGGTETLSIAISNVPEGIILSAGTDLGGGNWQLTTADLPGLTLSAEEHFNGDFELNVTVTATEVGGDTAITTSTMPVSIIAVADAPDLAASLGDTHEDGAADLDITGTLVDTDGSEELSYEISGLPAGSSLSAGIENADGTWTLSPDDLDGLQFNPPEDYSGDITFEVAALATEPNGDTARTEAVVEGNVTPVADTPDQSVNNVSGQEDTAIAIDVSSALTDSSETLSVQISNVPNGATLSHGTDLGNGIWSVDPADLSNLTVTPPADFSGSFDLEITSTATESDGSTASTSDTFTVAVSGVADVPDLDTTAASGSEGDTSISLDITSALTDVDNSETLSITVADLPNGVVLSAGTQNADGTWTLEPGDLNGLTMTAPEDFSGDFNLSISATSTEADGDTAVSSATLPVSIVGVADSPDVSVADVTGTEDNSLALDLSTATTDSDGSETITQTVITGVPDGFTLSVGTDLGNGQWSVPPSQLGSISLTAPEHYSGTINLGLTVTAEDTGGDTASTSTNFNATFSAVADAPNVGAVSVSGDEDSAIDLSVSSSLVDTDGSETLGVVISGLPDGATLSHGNSLGNGEWAVAAADLGDLSITPPTNFSGEINLNISATSTEPDGSTAVSSAPFSVTVDALADAPELTASLIGAEEDNGMAVNVTGTLVDTDGSENISYTISNVPDNFSLNAGTQNADGSWSLTPAQLEGLELVPPQDFSGNVSLKITAVSTDENGDTASTSTTVDGVFAAVADAPTAVAGNVSGDEDEPITLDLSASVTDVDGSETLGTVITGVPAGASVSGGTDLGNGRWSVDPADLGSVTVTPPAHFSGTMNLALESTATDTGGVTNVTTAPFSVEVASVVDFPVLETESARGNEDTSIAIEIDASLVDTDGSESLSVTIEGVPADFTLSAGTRNADGSWTLEPGDLDGLSMDTPQDYKGEFNLTVTATSTESDGQTSSVQSVIPVTVDAVADSPDLQISADPGVEDTDISLSISTETTDITGTETITGVVIRGVPDDASLSSGTKNTDGSWSLEPGQLEGLTLTPPADSNDDFTLSVTTTATEPNGSTSSTTASLPIIISGVADDPSLQTEDAAGKEDKPIALDIGGALGDTDGSESLHFEISDLPDGAKLSHGTQQANGTWIVNPADIDDLTITAPKNFSGEFDINVASVSTENDGDIARVEAPITVSVDAVADRAWVSPRSVSGTEDEPLDLKLRAAVTDKDSEEFDSMSISNVPDGFIVIGGTFEGNGVWSIPIDDFQSVSLQAPEDYSGTVGLKFNVTTVETENGDTATKGRWFRATFNADADAPNVTANDVETKEDTPVKLELSTQLTDVDGSEYLGVTISGVPEGATLSSGTDNGDGTWTVDPGDLDSLELTPPENFSGTINLSMQAVSTEASNKDTASSSVDFSIDVEGVADIPSLTVVNALGNEDSGVGLTIRAELLDTDGSESLYVEFSNVPDGASFSSGTQLANGNWVVPASVLDTLEITPPVDSNEDFSLTVRSLAEEADGSRVYSEPQELDVTVRGVPDAPDMNIGVAQGDEDSPISLNFNATSTDDDTSETISYVISDLPQGALLSGGVFIGNGRWSVSQEDMANLTITPPEDFSGDFDIDIRVVVQEDDGRQSSHDYSTTITVDPVVDDTARGGLDAPRSYGSATGAEDTAISLNLDPGLRDDDSSESVEWVEVSDIPDGAVLSVNGVALTVADEQEPGVFRIMPDDLNSVTILPAEDSGDDFQLSVKAMITDGEVSETSEGPLNVRVIADADAPIVSAESISGKAGEYIPVDISAALTDTDGSESLNFIISGLEGTSIVPTDGINIGGGSFLVSEEQLANLSFRYEGGNNALSVPVTVHAISTESEGDTAISTTTFDIDISKSTGGGGSGGGGGGNNPSQPPQLDVDSPEGTEDQSFGVIATPDFRTGGSQFGVVISNLPDGAIPNMGFYNPLNNSWVIPGEDPDLANLEISPPDDYAGSLEFTMTAVKTGHNGLTQESSQTVTASIDPVVDSPGVRLGSSSGTEDTPLDLDLRVNTGDSDGSEHVVSVIMSNVPEGAEITGATDLGDGRFSVDPNVLDQVSFVPPENEHGNYSFTVETVIEESDGSQASFSNTVGVNISAATDSADLTVNDVSGSEDSAIALDLAADFVDADGSEVMSVTITDVPEDSIFSAGSNNGDGSWTFTPAQLNGLTFTPPPDESGSFNMTLNSFTMEQSTGEVTTTSKGFTVDVEGVADAVIVDSQNTSGDEDTSIAVDIDYTEFDIDGSESVVVVLTGMPEGSFFSHGTIQPDGSWEVAGEDLASLTVTPPEHFSGDMNIHAEVITTDGTDLASTATDLTISVAPIADAAAVDPQDTTGTEDNDIPLDLGVSLTDSSETLEVVVSDLPEGAILSAGTQNADGSWTLNADDLDGLSLTPAENQSGEFTLTVTATSTEPETGETAISSSTMTVEIEGVADVVDVTAANASGNEDEAIAIEVDFSYQDTDGSESVTAVTVSGVPENGSLSVGTQNVDGTWTVDPADLSNMTFTAPENFSGDVNLSLSFLNEENDGDTLVTTQDITVSVAGVADDPSLTVNDTTGMEDTAISLNIQAALTDIDGSESLGSVTISGVPAGAMLSAGYDNGDGSWTLGPDDLDGLSVIPPENYAGDFNLNVTATSEEDGTQAEISGTLTVSVEGDPDAPIFNTEDASGTEGGPIDLNIQAETVADNESLTLTISDLPEGSSLSAGTENGDGSWTLGSNDTEGLQLNTPEDFSGDFSLKVTATVEQDGNSIETSQSIDVSVEAAPDPVILMSAGAQAYMDELGVGNEGNGESNGISEQAQDYAAELNIQSNEQPENSDQPDAQELEQTLNGNLGGDSVDTLMGAKGEDQADAMVGDQVLDDPMPSPPNDDMDQSNENADLLILENEMG